MVSGRDVTLAETLADFVVGFDLRSSPSRDVLVEKAKLHVLDAIGVALAARTMEDGYATKLLRAVRDWGSAADCTIIGFEQRAAPPLAAFMNGSLIHGAELDDASDERMVHPESFAVSVALAATDARGITFASEPRYCQPTSATTPSAAASVM